MKKGKRLEEKNKKGKQIKEQKNVEDRKTKKRKKKSVAKTILLIILLIILIFLGWFVYKTYKNGGGLSGMLATAIGHDENTKKDLPELRTLILGISTDLDGSKLTDTIMIASYNPNTQKAKLLSIPRDTFVGKNSAKATANEKMNAVYAVYGNPQKVLDVVNNLTGLDIQNYVIIKNEGLIELVDAIGGVEFDVPINMNYDDKTQNLHIHLNQGVQKLDGDKAEQLVRFRHNNDGTSYPSEYGDNDIGRMKTQRNFIIATLKQTLKPGNIFKLGQILDVAEKNVETNMNFFYLKDYIPYAVEFNTDDIDSEVLPVTVPDYRTTNNVSIAILNKSEAQKLIQSMFFEDEQNTDGNSTTNSVNSTNSTNATGKNTSNTSNSVSSKNTATKNTTSNTSKNTTSKNTITKSTSSSTSKNTITRSTNSSSNKNIATRSTTK